MSLEQHHDILPIKKAISGGIYLSIGKLLSFLASFVVVTVIANTLSRETAGTYNYTISVLSIISIATLPGTNQALSRSVAKGFHQTVHFLLKKRIYWGLLGSLTSIFFGIITLLSGNTSTGIAFIIAAPFIPITDTFSNLTFSFWKGKKQFITSSVTHLGYYVGLAVLSIPVFFITQNIIIIVTWVLSAQAISGYLVYRSIPTHTDMTPDPESLTLSIHLTLMQALKIIANNVDKMITFYLLGPVQVAIYTFAVTPIQKAIAMVPIGNVALPFLSESTFSESTKKTIQKKFFLLFFITIPITVVLYFFTPIIYTTLFPKYPESIVYFQILLISIIFLPVLLLKSALIAFNKTTSLYISELAVPIIKIGLMIGLALPFGIYGICIGFVISFAIDTLLSWYVFQKIPTN
jgi:O-antigen/teichoic acid export membrane protein